MQYLKGKLGIMASQKSRQLWMVNLVSFILLTLLAITGLLNWLVLPRGLGRGSWLMELRHLVMNVHIFLAVIFLLAIGIHLWLHASYIKANLVRSGWWRE